MHPLHSSAKQSSLSALAVCSCAVFRIEGPPLTIPCGRGQEKVWSAGRFLGEATNNVAEYDGLILGLEGAEKLGALLVS